MREIDTVDPDVLSVVAADQLVQPWPYCNHLRLLCMRMLCMCSATAQEWLSKMGTDPDESWVFSEPDIDTIATQMTSNIQYLCDEIIDKVDNVVTRLLHDAP